MPWTVWDRSPRQRFVLAAAEDILTPAAGAQELAEAIPGAQFHLLPRGSHVTAAEYPGEVSEALLAFLLA